MKRIITLLLVFLITILPAFADSISDVLPLSSVWGASRDAFITDSGYNLSQAKVGKTEALKRSQFELESYTMDGFYLFSVNFTTHKGLSKIAFILSNASNLSSQDIIDCKATMISAVTRLIGEPTSVTKAEAKWELPEHTIEIGAGKFSKYTGSDAKTVAIIITSGKVSTASGRNVYIRSDRLSKYELALRNYMFNPPSRASSMGNFINGLYTIDGLVYKSGSRGDAITELQNLLIGAGYLNAGDADGSYGKKTEKAVKSFQASCGLSNTGVIDLPTQFMLVMQNANYERKDSCFIAKSGKYAVVVWPMKALYIGLLNGKGMFSDGTYFYANKEYYAGSFKNNLRSGQGKAHFNNGDIYVGKWDNDSMNGNGKYYFGGENSGVYYEGEMANNSMYGKGTYWINGSKITGTWAGTHKSWF